MTADILILSNGPGELATWVNPVVQALTINDHPRDYRISLVLSPCPNGTGQELTIAQKINGIDRAQGANHFFPFLLWGKTHQNWDWCDRGVVIFLGGDQLFSVIIAKRLGYKTLTYGEWQARWPQWVDRFGVMNETVRTKMPPSYHHKAIVVGDLMADLDNVHTTVTPSSSAIGLMPGSKPAKLAQFLPFGVEVAYQLFRHNPQLTFQIPVAPNLQVKELWRWHDHAFNPVAKFFADLPLEIIQDQDQHYFVHSPSGLRIELITDFPCYDRMAQWQCCLTTVGANTAQLAALNVPMVVVVPTQQLDAMRAYDGLLGIMVNLPLLGTPIAKLINWLVINYALKTGKNLLGRISGQEKKLYRS